MTRQVEPMRSCPTCKRIYPPEMEYCPRDGARLHPDLPPTQVQFPAGLKDRYQILRPLGAGGMGTVFLAEQIRVGRRPVALKVLHRRLLDDPEFLARFQNEAASTGRIHSLHVVTIYESGLADDGSPYLAMEYLEGETLAAWLRRRGPLPCAEVAEIVRQAARGLAAAHRLGIIHRDLKPENLLLTRDESGQPLLKIMDFGIAKLRESSHNTLTGMVLGTPRYMSFEQAAGMSSDQLDARADIYSLGVMVYEMLAGRPPFQSDTPLGYVRQHLSDAPPPLRALAPPGSYPDDRLEAVVMKALAKDREQRYATIEAFAAAFSAAAEAVPEAENAAENAATQLPTIVLPLVRVAAGPEPLIVAPSKSASPAPAPSPLAPLPLAAGPPAFRPKSGVPPRPAAAPATKRAGIGLGPVWLVLSLLLLAVGGFELFFIVSQLSDSPPLWFFFYCYTESFFTAFLTGIIASGMASIIALARRSPRWEALALAAIEPVLVFNVILAMLQPFIVQLLLLDGIREKSSLIHLWLRSAFVISLIGAYLLARWKLSRRRFNPRQTSAIAFVVVVTILIFSHSAEFALMESWFRTIRFVPLPVKLSWICSILGCVALWASLAALRYRQEMDGQWLAAARQAQAPAVGPG